MEADSFAEVFPKRWGQLEGKDVVDLEEYLERIRSAVKARTEPDFVIIARTDARNAKQFGGPDAGRNAFLEGVKRLKAALEAGAGMAFMESPRTVGVRGACHRVEGSSRPHQCASSRE